MRVGYWAPLVGALLAMAGPCLALGSLTTLYQFTDGPDGRNPSGAMAIERGPGAGDIAAIYGETGAGGANGAGGIFQLTPPGPGQTAWTETTIWNFASIGANGSGGVIRDKHGRLYGGMGGGRKGCGAVFELRKVASVWRQKILWNFSGGAGDGCQPSATLNMDKDGNLYGATLIGGPKDHGTVFKLTPPAAGSSDWGETVIWEFDGADGDEPWSQLTFDSAGNLYGAAQHGGASNDGTVWELTPPAGGSGPWTRSIVWSFSGADGATPNGGPLVFTPSGALYGVAKQGGTFNHGLIFNLTPPKSPGGSWTDSTISTFTGPSNVLGPGPADIALTSKGDLIVARTEGKGAIIELRPPAVAGGAWTRRSLFRFDGADGDEPSIQPPLLARGVILGLAVHGNLNTGPGGNGSVWELAW